MPTHVSRPLRALAPALAVVVSASPAWGQNLELHGTASLATGYDSNPQSVPDNDDFTRQVAIAQQNELSEKQAAFVLQPTPGFIVDYLSPRVRFELIYNHPFYFFIGNDQANADADNAVFNLFYDVDPRTTATFGLYFNRLNTGLSTLDTAANTVIAARPGGDNTAIAVGGSQTLRHELSEFWRWEESANLGAFIPLAETQPIALLAGFSTGPEVRYGDHALGLIPSVSYLKPFVEDEAQAAELQYFTDHQLLVTGELRWRWDWSLSFGSEASAGVSMITDLDQERRIEPVGSGAILFTEEGYAATLRYTRAFNPNIVTGQTYLADTGSLSGTIPIYPDADIAAQTSIGGAFTRALDQRIELGESTAVTLIGDIAIGWYPADYPNLTLRYQHIEQVAARYEAYRSLPTFDRDVLLLQVSYTFPARTIKVPKGQSRRVDDSDRNELLSDGQQQTVGPRSSGQP